MQDLLCTGISYWKISVFKYSLSSECKSYCLHFWKYFVHENGILFRFRLHHHIPHPPCCITIAIWLLPVLYFYRAFFCTSRRLCVSVPAKTPRFSPARIFEQKMEEIIPRKHTNRWCKIHLTDTVWISVLRGSARRGRLSFLHP